MLLTLLHGRFGFIRFTGRISVDELFINIYKVSRCERSS
jgi:hypothetical protein